MSEANCFIVLPEERSSVAAGDLVEIQTFDGLL
jgi:molybdopterin molybdotransferase